eukprot:Hpha_TRINITY_DN30708_c0_g1::TRINITY_DN30708_c0_g1_i1::g.28376::m.28376/K11804/WDR42A; WD repeat-containing protein 42A
MTARAHRPRGMPPLRPYGLADGLLDRRLGTVDGGYQGVLRDFLAGGLGRRLELVRVQEGHAGCVNTVAYSTCGTALVSGSDDCRLLVHDSISGERLADVDTKHTDNIFCANFPPFDLTKVVSCGLDGKVNLTDLVEETSSTLFGSQSHHMATHLDFTPDNPFVFATSFAEGTVCLCDLREVRRRPPHSPKAVKKVVRMFHPRLRSRRKELLPVEAFCVRFNPTRPWCFALGGAEASVRLYDLRAFSEKTKPTAIAKVACRRVSRSLRERLCSGVTGVCWDSRGQRLAVNYSGDDLMIYDVAQGWLDDTEPRYLTSSSDDMRWDADRKARFITSCGVRYTGRVNVETTLKQVCFFENKYVVTGGDCGRVFLWDIEGDGRPVVALRGDERIVNGVAANPVIPQLAVCGIDPTVRIFEPGVGLSGGELAEELEDSAAASLGTQNENDHRGGTLQLMAQYVSHLAAAKRMWQSQRLTPDLAGEPLPQYCRGVDVHSESEEFS